MLHLFSYIAYRPSRLPFAMKMLIKAADALLPCSICDTTCACRNSLHAKHRISQRLHAALFHIRPDRWRRGWTLQECLVARRKPRFMFGPPSHTLLKLDDHPNRILSKLYRIFVKGFLTLRRYPSSTGFINSVTILYILCRYCFVHIAPLK